jgi:hypothetical protein
VSEKRWEEAALKQSMKGATLGQKHEGRHWNKAGRGRPLGQSMRGSSEAEREGVVDSGAKHEGSDPGTKATGCVGDVCGSWVHWFQVVCGVVVHCVVRYKRNLTLA